MSTEDDFSINKEDVAKLQRLRTYFATCLNYRKAYIQNVRHSLTEGQRLRCINIFAASNVIGLPESGLNNSDTNNQLRNIAENIESAGLSYNDTMVSILIKTM